MALLSPHILEKKDRITAAFLIVVKLLYSGVLFIDKGYSNGSLYPG